MNSEKLPIPSKSESADAKRVEEISEELRIQQARELLRAGSTTVQQIKEALSKQELTMDELMEYFMGRDGNETLH